MNSSSSAMNLLCGAAAPTENQNEIQKPYYGFAKLAIGDHKVFGFRLVNNKFHRPGSEKPGLPKILLVELEDQVLFLPENISKVFAEDEAKVAELNCDNIKKIMYFGGRLRNG